MLTRSGPEAFRATGQRGNSRRRKGPTPPLRGAAAAGGEDAGPCGGNPMTRTEAAVGSWLSKVTNRREPVPCASLLHLN